MSMVFKFRMLSDLSDNFVRDYEVMYDTNLLDFNDFICEDLGYDIEGMASFFFSDGQWRKLQEYTLMDMDTEAEQDEYCSDSSNAPIPMGDVNLGQIIHHLGDRLTWNYSDIEGEVAYYLELLEPTVADPAVEYPRTIFAHGNAINLSDANYEDEKSIFDEMMDDFNDFGGGDDSYDDEY